MTQVFTSLVGDPKHANFSFKVQEMLITASKSLVLHRIIEKEGLAIADLMREEKPVPKFIRAVAKAEPSEVIILSEIPSHFVSFLKFCYSETILDKVTCDDISNLAQVCKSL